VASEDRRAPNAQRERLPGTSETLTVTAPSLVPFGWNYSQTLDIVRHGGSCGMPAFAESELSDEELKQIVDYLKMLN